MRDKYHRVRSTGSQKLTTSGYIRSKTAFQIAKWSAARGYRAWIVPIAFTSFSHYPLRVDISAQSSQKSVMSSRTTRGFAAREAAFIASSKKQSNPQQLSSPPATPAPVSKKDAKKAPAKVTTKTGAPTNATLKTEDHSATASTPAATKNTKKAATKKTPNPSTSSVGEDAAPPTPAGTGRKRKRAQGPKVEEDINALPHNLGTLLVTASKDLNGEPLQDGEGSDQMHVKTELKEEGEDVKGAPSSKKRKTKKASLIPNEAKEIISSTGKNTSNAKGSPTKKAKKPKANPYGITPGKSPYPEWTAPTPEQCHEVNDVLSKMHGKVAAPEQIPVPSLTVTGCGEVPSIHDALLRTLLSANTTGKNAANAFQGIVRTFGTLSSGIGQGSADWDAVRRAPLQKLTGAIKSGGMGDKKSAYIKKILDLVYEEGIAQRDELIAQGKASVEKVPDSSFKKDDDTSVPTDTKITAETPLDMISVAKADQGVLSLDHMHAWSTEDAFMKFIAYPGIGVKTASCVLLFCMRRPSFAVDTHVFRLCKWLGWVPESATRDKAYGHLDILIPNELKYSLHQLFIRHGKSCPRCRAVTGEGSEGWAKGCPIEELVKRTGKKKGGVEEKGKAKAKGKVVKVKVQVVKKGKGKGKTIESEDGESELSELSDVPTEVGDEDATDERCNG